MTPEDKKVETMLANYPGIKARQKAIGVDLSDYE